MSTRAAEDAGAKSAEKPSVAKAAKDAGHAQPAERTAVDEALDKPVTLKYVAVPLKDVAAAIGQLAGINVLLDPKELSAANITPDTELTFACPRVPLHVALRYLCDKYDLGYVVDSENALLITTRSHCREAVVERVYDVHEFESPPDAIQPDRTNGTPGCGPGKRRVVSGSSGCQDSGAPELDMLVDAITACVAPTTWVQSGGSATIQGIDGTLVIQQTDEVHRQIAALLAALSAAAQHKDAAAHEAIHATATADDSLVAALNARRDFNFAAMPLKNFADFLRKQGVPVVIDWKALKEDANMTPDTQISFHATNVREVADCQHPQACALREMCLNYWTDDGFVFITRRWLPGGWNMCRRPYIPSAISPQSIRRPALRVRTTTD